MVFILVKKEFSMTLTLEIPPQVERELTREAEARGVAVPDLAVSLLEEAVVRPVLTTPAQEQRSPLQIRGWLDSLTEFTDQIPALPGRDLLPCDDLSRSRLVSWPQSSRIKGQWLIRT
jgi:hypothetical protein